MPKYHRPVVRLLRNLYGHPLVGLWWEKHCHNQIVKCGYEKMQGLECLYRRPSKKAFLSVYVDDLKLCGPEGTLASLWSDLTKHLKLDPPTEFHESTYLGCQQESYNTTSEDMTVHKSFWDQAFADDRSQFKTAGGTLLTELREANQSKRQVRKMAKEAKRDVSSPQKTKTVNATSATTTKSPQQAKSYFYCMTGHAEKCMENYLELAKMNEKQLKIVTTPGIGDHQIACEKFTTNRPQSALLCTSRSARLAEQRQHACPRGVPMDRSMRRQAFPSYVLHPLH